MRKHMFRQPGQHFRRSRSNDFSRRRRIFWRGAECLHHYFLQVGDVATDHWANLEAYQKNLKLMKSCWDAPWIACILLCKRRGADVADSVQPLFLKPIQQLQDFDEGFHEFRCEFCGREDHCHFVHLTRKNLSIGANMCRKLQLCWQDANFTLPALDIHYWRECPMLSACQFCEQVPSSTNFEESNQLHCDFISVFMFDISFLWLYFCLWSECLNCL